MKHLGLLLMVLSFTTSGYSQTENIQEPHGISTRTCGLQTIRISTSTM